MTSGQARITLDDVPRDITQGDTVNIPIGMKHRVENTGDVPTIFIEVQMGSYLGEDDIIRYDDDYGRV